MKQLKSWVTNSQPIFPSGLSDDLKDFLAKLLAKDPKTRLGAKGGVQEILSHPWLRGISVLEYKEGLLAAPKFAEPMTKTLRPIDASPGIVDESTFVETELIETKYIRRFSFQAEDPNGLVLQSRKFQSCGQIYLRSNEPNTLTSTEENGVNYCRKDFDEKRNTKTSIFDDMKKYEFKSLSMKQL
mmetsp:Transcript_79008/g.92360  ORF Transcript_79008/g.92360 Transcript_79008/m.92360 type:complete len:185 (-) Transcript_79008:253-807(-)